MVRVRAARHVLALLGLPLPAIQGGAPSWGHGWGWGQGQGSVRAALLGEGKKQLLPLRLATHDAAAHHLEESELGLVVRLGVGMGVGLGAGAGVRIGVGVREGVGLGLGL